MMRGPPNKYLGLVVCGLGQKILIKNAKVKVKLICRLGLKIFVPIEVEAILSHGCLTFAPFANYK